MKKIKALLFATGVSLALATGISSCNTDKCKDVVCKNDGLCTEGVCDCPAGFEGEFCETKANAKFAGSWTVTDTALSSTYISVISTSTTSPSAITVGDFGHYGCTSGAYAVPATIDATGKTFTFNGGVVCGTTYTGSGTINTDGNSITGNYTAVYGTTTDAGVYTMAK